MVPTMNDYKTVATTPEVWAVVHASHHNELVPFSSFSNPDGTFNGGCGQRGEMFTAYGFKGADYPLMEAKTTWEIDRETPYKRINEQHRYWLCLPTREDD